MDAFSPSQVAVVRVGMDLSGSQWGNNLAAAPEYFLKNGLRSFLLKKFGNRYRELVVDAAPSSQQREGQEVQHLDDILRVSRDVQWLTRQLFMEGAFVILLGGEQTADLGLVAGAATSGTHPRHHRRRISLSSLDGHLDCHFAGDSITNHVHGQVRAADCGYGQRDLVNFHGGTPTRRVVPRVKGENIVIVGTNEANVKFFSGLETTCDPSLRGLRARTNEQEIANAKAWGIKTFPMHEIQKGNSNGEYLASSTAAWQNRFQVVLNQILCQTRGHVVLCDLDHLHEDVAPGVAMRNPEGMSLEQSLWTMRTIARQASHELMGVAIVEGDPAHDIDKKTARVTVELMSALTSQMR
ncbi:MAG: arginase family protein [Candidatus Peribacteraceae bacterium]|nr:arginase family protein [Candidatus Peribacteraceae bacterium]